MAKDLFERQCEPNRPRFYAPEIRTASIPRLRKPAWQGPVNFFYQNVIEYFQLRSDHVTSFFTQFDPFFPIDRKNNAFSLSFDRFLPLLG
jgi:hypothetical protein